MGSAVSKIYRRKYIENQIKNGQYMQNFVHNYQLNLRNKIRVFLQFVCKHVLPLIPWPSSQSNPSGRGLSPA